MYGRGAKISLSHIPNSPNTHVLTYADGSSVTITAAQYELIWLFMTRGWVSKDAIIKCLWPNPSLEPNDSNNTLYVRLVHLRRKLKPAGYAIKLTLGGYALREIPYFQKPV